jgi:hypothetical protein
VCEVAFKVGEGRAGAPQFSIDQSTVSELDRVVAGQKKNSFTASKGFFVLFS